MLAWILGIHQLEANVLNPKIMGDAAKIHPVLVIFSLLAGEHFFRVPGALLAVPTMSIAQSLFLHLNDVTEKAASRRVTSTEACRVRTSAVGSCRAYERLPRRCTATRAARRAAARS